MSEQKEKTALELVDELIEGKDRFVGTDELHDIKAAIERERDKAQEILNGYETTIQDMNDRLKSAITMRPISELPDKVPDGCVCVLVSATYLWMLGNSELIKNSLYVTDNFKTCRPTHFYVLPLSPSPERKLHKCYMPGCGGEAKIEKTFTGRQYAYCEQCGAHGPVCGTMQEAKDAWGYE